MPFRLRAATAGDADAIANVLTAFRPLSFLTIGSMFGDPRRR